MPGLALSELYVYPIKSVGGISLREARLDERSISYDRRWMLVDENGKFMSQRRHPRMALISTCLTAEYLIVEAPEMPELRLTLKPEDRPRMDVLVWSDAVRAMPVGNEAEEWFSTFLGDRCRLVYMPDDQVRQVDREYAEAGDRVGFADGFPFLLVSRASLEDLGDRLGRRVPVNRFRPNLVVEGCDAFAEGRLEQAPCRGRRLPCRKALLPVLHRHDGSKLRPERQRGPFDTRRLPPNRQEGILRPEPRPRLDRNAARGRYGRSYPVRANRS